MKHSLTCLITGAAGGIGTAVANKLSSLNYDLILVSKRKAKLEKLENRLKNKSKNKEINNIEYTYGYAESLPLFHCGHNELITCLNSNND